NAIAALEVTDEVNLLGHNGKSRSSANSAAHPGVIKCSRDRGEAASAACGKICRDERLSAARINAIAELTENADDFVVTPFWIQCCFDEEVRRLVCRVAGCIHEVVEAAAHTRRVEEEVVVRAAATKGCLRSLYRGSHGKFVAEALGHAEAVRALPGPADDI